MSCAAPIPLNLLWNAAAARAFETGIKQLDVRGSDSYLPPVQDVNRPVDGAGRSPNAPAPHTDTPLHGVTEATVWRHTHLPLVPDSLLMVLTLLFSAVPPLFLCRLRSAGGRSHPCSTWPASSSVSLCRAARLSQEFSLPLAGADALPPAAPGHHNDTIHPGPGWKCSFNFWERFGASVWILCGLLQVFFFNNNLSAPSPELR